MMVEQSTRLPTQDLQQVRVINLDVFGTDTKADIVDAAFRNQ
jgi:hypothetical protein